MNGDAALDIPRSRNGARLSTDFRLPRETWPSPTTAKPSSQPCSLPDAGSSQECSNEKTGSEAKKSRWTSP